MNRINNYDFLWETIFDPENNKQSQDAFFSQIQKSAQPSLIFNNDIVTQSITQKHLGMFMDIKLDFQEHLKDHTQ